MKKLLVLVAVLGFSVSIVGCSDTKKPADKPKPADTTPAPDAGK
ncbi:MAG TPA: hypothetical protein VGJ26_06685 [Pirellulales bacterium]|jgi:hypothetical protein